MLEGLRSLGSDTAEQMATMLEMKLAAARAGLDGPKRLGVGAAFRGLSGGDTGLGDEATELAQTMVASAVYARMSGFQRDVIGTAGLAN